MPDDGPGPSWVAPYFAVSRQPGDDLNPAQVLIATTVQVLNVSREQSVAALILFWSDGKRLEDLGAELEIPPLSMRDYRPFVSTGEVAGWVSVSASGPVVPGGWVDQVVDGQVLRVSLAFRPRDVDEQHPHIPDIAPRPNL